MKNFRFLLYICMAGMAIPSGAQDGAMRMAGNAVGLENLKVERSGSNLVVDMDLRLDDLKLPSNVRFVFTPLVKGSGNVRQMSPVVVNGRRQQISYERFARKDFVGNPVVVRRRNGKEQTVHYTGVLPYESWMENANVVLAEDLCGCGDLLDQNTAVLQRLRNYRTAYIRPQAEARKERHEEGRAYLDFPVNKTTLYPDYRNNPQELEKILRTINVVREDRNTTITHISIHGYASPEDTYEHNSYLAENRALMLKEYVGTGRKVVQGGVHSRGLGRPAALRERQQPGA